MNFAVFFKGVDVVKHKERVHREDAQAVAVLSIDNMESGTLVWIPVKPLFRAGGKESVAEDSPNVIDERTFGDHNVVISERETVEIRRSIAWGDFAKHLTSTKRGIS